MDGLLDLPNVIGIKEASSDMSRVYEFRLRYGRPLPNDLRLRRPGPRLLPVGQQRLDWRRRLLRPAPTRRRAKSALANDFVTARAAMDKLMPLMRNLESGGYTQKVKRGCELLGFPVGAPRRPLLPLLMKTAKNSSAFSKSFRMIESNVNI
jgi:4-hydroxy-tetrahydrodipicolinate synthase